MNMNLEIINWKWNVVHKLERGIVIPKGRKEAYRAIIESAKNVNNKFGCYSWGDEERIFYCGSFSKEYQRKNHQNNFQERIHNYLQNHRVKENRTNTNKMVFDNINSELKRETINLNILTFDYLILNSEKISFIEFSSNSELVKAVESILISFYKKADQCRWNRN